VKAVLTYIVAPVIVGVLIFWLTTGYMEQRKQEQTRGEEMRKEDEARRRQAQLDKERREAQPKMSGAEVDYNRNGGDYKDFVAGSLQDCLSACERESRCKAITFTKSSRQCWMKESVPSRAPDSLYISAVKVG